nr:hypothetical protein [Bacteroidales bacterium]
GNNRFIRLPFPVCRFYLGGESTLRRDILLKEGYDIHRRIVGDGILLAGAKLIKRRITMFLLDNLTPVYRILR